MARAFRHAAAGADVAMAVAEFRFQRAFSGRDWEDFREDLVDLAGAFTETAGPRGRRRYIVGLAGVGAERRLRECLAGWADRTVEGRIELEERGESEDPDEIYFLLPLNETTPFRRNPCTTRTSR